MRLSDAVDGYWLARRRELAATTRDHYGRTLKRLIVYTGDPAIETIDARLLHAFLNYLQLTYTMNNKSLLGCYIVLSSFFTWAALELDLPHPMRGKMRPPKPNRPPVEAYSETEIKALLAACETTAGWLTPRGKHTQSRRPTALRDRAILITLVDAGLRCSELCNLTLADYEAHANRLTVRHGKGDKRRIVYLGDHAVRAIWRYLATRPGAKPGDPLFASRRGVRLSRYTLKNMIRAIGQRAGVRGATLHRFRHTFAITFLRNGGNVFELQKLLGHERIDTVQIYAKLAQSDLARAQAIASPADRWAL